VCVIPRGVFAYPVSRMLFNERGPALQVTKADLRFLNGGRQSLAVADGAADGRLDVLARGNVT